MRILKRKDNGSTGRMIVDSLPSDAKSGDILEEVSPGIAQLISVPFDVDLAIAVLDEEVGRLTFPDVIE